MMERRRERIYLPAARFSELREAFDEFDYFVCDVFFFAVDCDHVILRPAPPLVFLGWLDASLRSPHSCGWAV